MTLGKVAFPAPKITRNSVKKITLFILFFAALLALNSASFASETQGQTASARRANKPAQAPDSEEAARHVDRMAILAKERGEIAAKLGTADTPASKTRAQQDLDAIDREIALVGKQNPTASSAPTPPKQAGKQVAAYRPAPANESQPDDGKPKPAYESWDIFRNFGNK